MKKLLMYIFAESYMFSKNITGDNEFPHFYGAFIFTYYITLTIYVPLSLIEYYLLLNDIVFDIGNPGLFALLALAVIFIYINHRKRYYKYIEYYNSISKHYKHRLLFISIIYLFCLIISDYKIGSLIRQLYMG